MTTKKAAKRATRPAPRKAVKKTADVVVEFDAKTVTTFLGNLTASIERSNNLIANLGRQAPSDASAPSQGLALGCEVDKATSAPLPALEVIANALADKCRTLYAFSCHLREQVEEGEPADTQLAPRASGLKGQLDEAFRVLDLAHDNFMRVRNIITK